MLEGSFKLKKLPVRFMTLLKSRNISTWTIAEVTFATPTTLELRGQEMNVFSAKPQLMTLIGRVKFPVTK